MSKEVQEAFERCLQRYPTIQLPFETYQARIEEIVSREMSSSGEESRPKAFSQIHHEDLFLAIACSRDDRIAWEYFADDYWPVLRRYAIQACGDPGEGEDLAQEITTRLLKEKNLLAGYNGRGSLAGWLRAAVSHAAIDRFRRMRRQVSLEDLRENEAPAALADPVKSDGEEDLDSRWGPVISQVVGETISALPARDRLILALYYLREVPLKAIGRQFKAHEATVSRWLNRMRQDIRKQVERELRKKHGLRPQEIQSLWRTISIASVTGPIAGNKAPPAGTDMSKGVDCGQKNAARRID